MTFNRRNVLIGIATVAMITGAVLGSGALTTVEADRSLNIETADDSDAYVGLTPNSTLVGTSTGANGQEVLNLSLDQLNDNATTSLDPAFDVTNNFGDEVEVEINGVPSSVTITPSSAQTLSAGDTVHFDLEVDTTSSISTGENTITISATTTS